MIPESYKPKKKFMQLAIAETKRAGGKSAPGTGATIPLVPLLPG